MGQDREDVLEVDQPLLGPGPVRCGRRIADEGAPADLAGYEPPPGQIGIDPARGRDGDPALMGELPLRRQSGAGGEAAGRDVRSDPIGNASVVGHTKIAPSTIKPLNRVIVDPMRWIVPIGVPR